MGVVPPALAEAAIVGPTSDLVRRVEIWEADGLTRWQNGANDYRLIDGSVSVDYSRDERRSIDLTLDNSDFGLQHTPEQFWYDKVLKTFCGVEFIDQVPVDTVTTRKNMWTNSRFATGGAAYAARTNLFTNPTLAVDSNSDGVADGWLAYNPTGTATYTMALVGGVQQVNSITIAAGSRCGVYVDIPVTASSTQKRTVSMDFTLAGTATNKRFTIYGMLLDSSNASVAGTPVSTFSQAASGRLAVTVPADINGVKLRMYGWFDTADGAASNGTMSGSMSKPLMEESGIELPYFDINTAPKELYNLHPNSLCTNTTTQSWFSNNGAVYPVARDTTRGTPFGDYSMLWTRTSTTPNTTMISGYSHNGAALNGWKCNAGDSVTVSMWMSTEQPNRRGWFYIAFRDASDNPLTINYSAPKYAITPGGWSEVYWTDVAPTGAASFYPIYILESSDGSNIPAGEQAWTTAFMIYKSPYKRPFFHPSLAAPSGFTAAWDGPANSSPTYLYQTDPVRAWSGTANASTTELRFTPPANTTGLYGTYSKTLRCTQDSSALTAYSARVWCYGNQAGAGALIHYQTTTIPGANPGEQWAMRYRARVVQSNGRSLGISMRLGAYSTTSYIDSVTGTAFVQLPADGSWVDIDLPWTKDTPAGTVSMRYLVYAWGGTGSSISENECFEIEAVVIERDTKKSGGYFNGSIPNFSGRVFTWDGTVDNSYSTETRTVTTYVPTRTLWETQVGEFMIDSISEDNFPYVVKVNGRDYTKKCLTSKFTTATTFANGQAIETTIKTIATNAGISKFILPLTGKTLGKAYTFERGTTRWEAMKGIADAYGYELFFDAQGYLVMREYLDPITAPLAYTLETGTYGNLVSYTKAVNDTRIYNHIVVTGESSDSTVIPVSAEAKNTEPSSPTRIAAIGDRVYEYVSSFITTTAQAQDVANKFLQIHALEEFDLNFSSIALPWLEVGEIVQFDDPRPSAGQPTRFLLSSLTIPLGLGAMGGNAKRVSVVG